MKTKEELIVRAANQPISITGFIKVDTRVDAYRMEANRMFNQLDRIIDPVSGKVAEALAPTANWVPIKT